MIGHRDGAALYLVGVELVAAERSAFPRDIGIGDHEIAGVGNELLAAVTEPAAVPDFVIDRIAAPCLTNDLARSAHDPMRIGFRPYVS